MLFCVNNGAGQSCVLNRKKEVVLPERDTHEAVVPVGKAGVLFVVAGGEQRIEGREKPTGENQTKLHR